MKRIVVDGNYIAMRNFHAYHPDNIQSHGISFLQTIFKIIKTDGYQSQVIVAWDGGHFRYRGGEGTEEYKATREYDDSFQILWDSIDNLRELLPYIGIPSLKYDGVEADDIGYYMSYLAKTQNIDTLLVSSDRDWLISVNEKCSLYRPNTKDDLWTWQTLNEEYELNYKASFLLYKSILGDPSDNIIGLTKSHSNILKYIEEYQNNTLNLYSKNIIDSNINLMRLDRIVSDAEVTNSIDNQLKLVYLDPRKCFAKIKSSLGSYPPYFYGMGRKYINTRLKD